MDEIIQNLKERIYQARTAAGMTQIKISQAIGVSKTLYNKYEKADVRPPFSVVVKLSRVLNVSMDYLAGNVEDPQGIKNMPRLSQHEQQLLEKFALLNEEGQLKLEDHLDDLLLTGKYLRYVTNQSATNDKRLFHFLQEQQQELTQSEIELKTDPNHAIPELPQATKDLHQKLFQKWLEEQEKSNVHLNGRE